MIIIIFITAKATGKTRGTALDCLHHGHVYDRTPKLYFFKILFELVISSSYKNIELEIKLGDIAVWRCTCFIPLSLTN